MKLIVGLGNPGKQYELTRHNAGFFVLDKLCDKINVSLSETKFKGQYGTYFYKGEKIIILKPQTYMNLSGESVLAFVDYFNIDVEDIIVVHDDLDLPLGKLRIRQKGSSGGQKGMGNIIDLLHTKDIKRIRVGISHDTNIDTKDYVLGKIGKDDFKLYEETCKRAADAIICSFDEDFITVMNRFNG